MNAGTIAGAVKNAGNFTSTGTLSGGLVNSGAARISGAPLDRAALAARLEATLELARNISLSAGYSGLIGQSVTDHGARATLQVRF